MSNFLKLLSALLTVFLIGIFAVLGVRVGDELWFKGKKLFGWKPGGKEKKE